MFDSLKKKFKSFFKKEEEMLEDKIEEVKEKRIEIEPKVKPKLTVKTKFKKAIVRKARITEDDVKSLLEDFNLSLLEADVAVSVAEEVCEKIKEKLVGQEVSGKRDIRKLTFDAIRKTLEEILIEPDFDFAKKVREKKPFVIMFLGPNGHGKSTSIGKVAEYLKKKNMSCVMAASDTFRAASIEQLEKIGEKVGVRVVKHRYGADPAAVAFDGIAHAKAKGIDVVLIDTAGRSELDKNLMEEMKKIARVAKPDLKIYVGEALAGNAAVDEARKFDEFIGLDGIIMTKVDTDVKGGSILSVSYVTGKPILFLGTGQGMNDLKSFDKEWFINKILT